MGEVVRLDCDTLVDMPSETILDAAKAADLDHVLVLGLTKDGADYFASTSSDIGLCLLLTERFKKQVIT